MRLHLAMPITPHGLCPSSMVVGPCRVAWAGSPALSALQRVRITLPPGRRVAKPRRSQPTRKLAKPVCKRSVEGGYLFTSEGLREALKGFDFKRALDMLQGLEALPAPMADGKRSRFFRVGGTGMRLYQITPEKLEGSDYGA